MNNNSKNTWLNDEGSRQIRFYSRSADVFIVERKRALQLISDIFSFYFSKQEGLNILDLGCGDGIISEYLINKYPDNSYFLSDGSEEMLSKAKERLKGKKAEFIKSSFEEYIAESAEKDKYDFVFSSMAMHHLNLDDKGKLFSKIYSELNEDGLLLIFDSVRPETELSESIQFRMWRDWMREIVEKNGILEDKEVFNNLPEVYRAKEENKPDTLSDQLDLLKKSGFNNVDCFFKYSIFALFGATK